MVRPVMVTFWAIEAPEREACGVPSLPIQLTELIQLSKMRAWPAPPGFDAVLKREYSIDIAAA
jgi:hypothetical protein